MAFTRSPIFRLVAAVTILILPVAAYAADLVGKPSGGGAAIEWQLNVSGHDSIELTVLGPDGESWVKKFPAGRTPSFRLLDLGSDLADGQYNYQLRVNPKVSADLRKRLDAARTAGDDAAARKLIREAGLVAPEQSGAFTVRNSSIVSPDEVENGSNATLSRPITTDAARTTPRLTPATEDQVIPDDLIVQGSACIGLDCVNNESFGFDTIRMKENNTRIKFEDTSVGTFPTTDWQLTANDSASGGQNKLSIEDITGSTVPFTVEGTALTNSVYVDSTGRIGFRTSTPVLDLHVSTGNTPALRLEQTSASGFTAQTWDIAGNEANFFVRDVTGGSRLPFRIRPGAPTSSIDIDAEGDVGIGTASPSEKLHVSESVDAASFILLENTNTGTSANPTVSVRGDTARFDAKVHSSTRTLSRFGVTLGGWSEIGGVTGNGIIFGTQTASPVILGNNNIDRLHIDTDGDIGINCNAPGFDLVIASGSGCSTPSSSINAGSTQFTAASSRTFKENIQPMAVPDVLEKIEKVAVYQYDFKQGPKDRVGLIAEDFHQIFERGDEKYIDGNEVQMALWLAVRELSARNKELTNRLSELESQVKETKND